MSQSSFVIATFNANSIRARLEQVVEWLGREAPDVLCLQETKAQDADFPAEALRACGYHVVFRGQKSYNGVALLSREEPQEVAFGLDDDGPADEPRLVRAVVRGIHIVNTYVPQGQSVDSPQFAYKLEWFERLGSFFERHYAPSEPALWVGDLNVAPEPIDVHDPKGLAEHVDFHPLARQALAALKEWGWVDILRKHHPGEPNQYTFWDYRVRNAQERNVGWRVDHILATDPLAQRSLRCWIDVEARRAERPSDHTLLVAEFAL
jgi:exodeoxyribonuclease-3